MPDATAAEWEGVTKTSLATKNRPKALPHDAIRVKQHPHPTYGQLTEFRAFIHLSQAVSADNDALRTRPKTKDDIERRLRAEIVNKLYGKVRSDAREAFLGLRDFALSSGAIDSFRRMEELLAPLLNAGQELVDPQD